MFHETLKSPVLPNFRGKRTGAWLEVAFIHKNIYDFNQIKYGHTYCH